MRKKRKTTLLLPILVAFSRLACVPQPLPAAEVVPYVDPATGALWPPALEARVATGEAALAAAEGVTLSGLAAVDDRAESLRVLLTAATMNSNVVVVAGAGLESANGDYALTATDPGWSRTYENAAGMLLIYDSGNASIVDNASGYAVYSTATWPSGAWSLGDYPEYAPAPDAVAYAVTAAVYGAVASTAYVDGAVGAVTLAGLAAVDDRAASLRVLADVGNKSAPTNGVIAASGRGDLDTPSQSFGAGVWALGEFSPSWAQYAFRGARGAEVYPGIDAPEGGWDADQWYLLEAENWVPGMTYDDLRLFSGPVALDPSGVYTSGILSPVTLSWTGSLPDGPMEYAAVASVPYVDARWPQWPSADIATNIVWSVVVSNGHWLVFGTEVAE